MRKGRSSGSPLLLSAEWRYWWGRRRYHLSLPPSSPQPATIYLAPWWSRSSSDSRPSDQTPAPPARQMNDKTKSPCSGLQGPTTPVASRGRIVKFLFSFFLFKNFYCYSVTVVCIFSPSLHPTPTNPTSLPHLYPPPWFCPCVLYSSSCRPLSPLSPPHSPLAIVMHMCFWVNDEYKRFSFVFIHGSNREIVKIELA